jgi:hypothetical protein
LIIEIQDTGIGIKEDDLKKLFKHFGKLKDTHKLNKKGTGLGLNISKRIVESMGGEIKVTSKVGEGTTFSMFIVVQAQTKAIDASSSKKYDISEYLDSDSNTTKNKKLGANRKPKLGHSSYASMLAMQASFL